jgi:hypothetical protein
MELVNFVPAGSNLYLISSCTTTFLLHDKVDIFHNFNSALLNNVEVELIFEKTNRDKITDKKDVDLIFYHVGGKELLRFEHVKLYAAEERIFETRIGYLKCEENDEDNVSSNLHFMKEPKLSCTYKLDASSINKVNSIKPSIRKKICGSRMFKVILNEHIPDGSPNTMTTSTNTFVQSVLNTMSVNLYIDDALTKDTRECIIL